MGQTQEIKSKFLKFRKKPLSEMFWKPKNLQTCCIVLIFLPGMSWYIHTSFGKIKRYSKCCFPASFAADRCRIEGIVSLLYQPVHINNFCLTRFPCRFLLYAFEDIDNFFLRCMKDAWQVLFVRMYSLSSNTVHASFSTGKNCSSVSSSSFLCQV